MVAPMNVGANYNSMAIDGDRVKEHGGGLAAHAQCNPLASVEPYCTLRQIRFACSFCANVKPLPL
jgi:hypothetical protein